MSLSKKMQKIGIRQLGDPILENICQKIDLSNQKDLAIEIIDKLEQTITAAQKFHVFNKGLGLAAPQIGFFYQIAIVMPSNKTKLILINPRIITQSKSFDEQYEGCWSFFDVRGLVPRPLNIIIAYQTIDEKEIENQFTDATARLVLHEIDHLLGILYPLRIKKGQKLLSYQEYKNKSQPWKYQK